MSRDEGIVYLVGAGPGDPGSPRVRRSSLIERADVIVYDRLVPPRLLDARARRRGAHLRRQGAGRPGIGQEEINALLVEHGPARAAGRAPEGRRPVRVRPRRRGGGGAARGGRPFEVVPGVTAGVAAPAYAGIPVTHRDEASAVAFVTAHEDPAKPESALDWAALAALPRHARLLHGRRAAWRRWPRA